MSASGLIQIEAICSCQMFMGTEEKRGVNWSPFLETLAGGSLSIEVQALLAKLDEKKALLWKHSGRLCLGAACTLHIISCPCCHRFVLPPYLFHLLLFSFFIFRVPVYYFFLLPSFPPLFPFLSPLFFLFMAAFFLFPLFFGDAFSYSPHFPHPFPHSSHLFSCHHLLSCPQFMVSKKVINKLLNKNTDP
jgi:hypothetical protein